MHGAHINILIIGRNTRITSTDLAGISASFLIASTEHTGGDLVVIVIRSITNSVTDDGDVCFLKNIS